VHFPFTYHATDDASYFVASSPISCSLQPPSCIPVATPLWISGQALAFPTHILCYRSCIIHTLLHYVRCHALQHMHTGSNTIMELRPCGDISSSSRHGIGSRQVQVEDCVVLLGQATSQTQVRYAQRLCGYGTQCACKDSQHSEGILPHTVLNCMEQAIRQTQIWYAPRLCGYGTQCACTHSQHSSGYFAPHSAQLHGAGNQTDTDLVCTKALWVWDAMCLHRLTSFRGLCGYVTQCACRDSQHSGGVSYTPHPVIGCKEAT